MRRNAQDAGWSGLKWYVAPPKPSHRLRTVLFWLLCLDLGALAGLLVTR